MSKIEEIRAALEGATPGPWRIVPYDAGDKDEWAMWTPMIDGSEDADRAVVHWAGFRQKYWQSADGKQSEIEANARLIALAPDMARIVLAAEELAYWVDKRRHSPGERVDFYNEKIAAASAAYRKAVGGKA